jgi:hypothetical protein
MSKLNLATEHVASLIKGSLTPDASKKIAEAVIDACSKSENLAAEFKLVNKDGLPCVVSISGPFGICICVVPPGGSC